MYNLGLSLFHISRLLSTDHNYSRQFILNIDANTRAFDSILTELSAACKDEHPEYFFFISCSDIPVELQNPHVIKKHQMFVGVLKAGPDTVALNSSFKNRYKDKNFSHSLKHSDVKSVVFVIVVRSQGHYKVRDRSARLESIRTK